MFAQKQFARQLLNLDKIVQTGVRPPYYRILALSGHLAPVLALSRVLDNDQRSLSLQQDGAPQFEENVVEQSDFENV